MSSPSPVVRRLDLANETWNGIMDRLEKLFGPRSRLTGGDSGIKVIPSSNLDASIGDLQRRAGGDLSLPLVAVIPGNLEMNTGSYNASMMRRYGVKSSISEDRSTWTILSLVPVVVTYQVLFVVDDLQTLLRMQDRWMANELWGFELVANDYNIRVKVIADKSFSIPPRTPDAAGSDQFRQTATLRAETYSGYLWQVPSVYTTEIDLAVGQKQLDSLDDLPTEDFQIVRRMSASDHEPEA